MPIPLHSSGFDIEARSRKAMLDQGFDPDFPPETERALAGLSITEIANSSLPDLTDLPWSSIDNPDSRDLDQIEYIERRPEGRLRLLVGIADVDLYVERGSIFDQHAALNTVSVYTGIRTFPMLPEKLSADLTSLVEGKERAALVVELLVENGGAVHSAKAYRARVENKARLDYGSVSAWREHKAQGPDAMRSVPGLEEQLALQFEAAERLFGFRKEQGALTFSESEPVPIVRNGELRELAVTAHNPARHMIETFMIAANVAVAERLHELRIPSIRRIVKVPKRWDRIREIAGSFGTALPAEPDPRALSDFLGERKEHDPARFPELSLTILKLIGPGEYAVTLPDQPAEMHFGLAVHDYTHSTAPNRRYADLIAQRLLKSASAVYSVGELERLAVHCTERSRAARKIERLMRKIAGAMLLRERVGELFDGIVTGAKPKGTYHYSDIFHLRDFQSELNVGLQ